jgi:ABC-2 type transport system permease protein
VAGLNLSAEARGQFAAIARVRWEMFVNSARTMRGRLEMVSRVMIGFSFAMGGLGGAIGLAAASWYVVSHEQSSWLALMLWMIFVFWQLFPVVATAFTEAFDSTNLLRFPLSYSSYFLVRLVYGSLDPSTALGSLWLLGIWIGTVIANPQLAVPSALVLFVFALMNIFLARMIFAWVERWLAQRKTREIMGIVFFLIVISFQFIGPITGRLLGRRQHTDISRFSEFLLPVERVFPPGVTAAALEDLSLGDVGGGFLSLGFLCAYAAGFLWLLNFRVRAQYRGESLSEAPAPVPRRAAGAFGGKAEPVPLRIGWNIPVVSEPVAAIYEKEMRYLMRSGPMLFTLVMPLVILLIFRVSPSRSGSTGVLGNASNFAFPIGAGYALLMLTNLIYNCFGADGSGIQFFFVSPVPFREIMFAKNLVHATILGFSMFLIWLEVVFLYRPPSAFIAVTTIVAVFFAAPANMIGGNLLSLYTPRKFDFGHFGRQRAANTTAFASLGVQLVVVLLGAAAFGAGYLLHKHWIATVLLLLLAGIVFFCYDLVLGRVDRIALDRRDTLITELSKT